MLSLKRKDHSLNLDAESFCVTRDCYTSFHLKSNFDPFLHFLPSLRSLFPNFPRSYPFNCYWSWYLLSTPTPFVFFLFRKFYTKKPYNQKCIEVHNRLTKTTTISSRCRKRISLHVRSVARHSLIRTRSITSLCFVTRIQDQVHLLWVVHPIWAVHPTWAEARLIPPLPSNQVSHRIHITVKLLGAYLEDIRPVSTFSSRLLGFS